MIEDCVGSTCVLGLFGVSLLLDCSRLTIIKTCMHIAWLIKFRDRVLNWLLDALKHLGKLSADLCVIALCCGSEVDQVAASWHLLGE